MPGSDDDKRDAEGAVTEEAVTHVDLNAQVVRRFQVSVMDGPQRGLVWNSIHDRCAIGTHASNDLVLEDPTVSRFHCELQLQPGGLRVRDIDSRNGTLLEGVPIFEALARTGSTLRLGRTMLRIQLGLDKNALMLSDKERFGTLVGRSVAMRATFAMLERAAPTDATVLLQGETGTGKEGAAESLCRASNRRGKPFIVVDCSAIPAELLESELFGHERGAFTGAAARRVGVFEEANGGTIFLDEIGEMPLDLQPKLLRVLESRELRRVGSNTVIPVDVRVIAATNRDLRSEVNGGRFRADLYFRLAVVRIPLPPLRTRPDDFPLLVDSILENLAVPANQREPLRTPAFLESLKHGAWPGNVRELRNYLERCLVFREPLPMGEESTSADAPATAIDPMVSYGENRRRALASFEHAYVGQLLAAFKGQVAEAARTAGVDKAYIYRLMRRCGMRS